MRPKWTKKLSEVTLQKTVVKEYLSEKTGNKYSTDVIPAFRLVSTGSIEEKENGYKYAVVDAVNGLEYEVTVPEKIEVKFGMVVEFSNFRGGALSNGVGWYKADKIREVQRGS